MARSKPDMQRVWAETGPKIDPDTEYGAGKYEDGWDDEIPVSEVENYTQNRQDQFEAHVNDYGVPHWDNVTEYPDKAWSRSPADGFVYQALSLVPAGEDDPSLEPTYWVKIDITTLVNSSGVVLTEIDMTNGGANDLNNIDITWQSAWDSYDYVTIEVEDVNVQNDGRVAFALATTGAPSTWLQIAGTTKEAVGWSASDLGSGENFSGAMRVDLKTHLKIFLLDYFTANINGLIEANDSFAQIGTVFDYAGATLTGNSSVGNWIGWNTGANGLNNHILRFTHEVGNFTSGTFKIVGYNRP